MGNAVLMRKNKTNKNKNLSKAVTANKLCIYTTKATDCTSKLHRELNCILQPNYCFNLQFMIKLTKNITCKSILNQYERAHTKI